MLRGIAVVAIAAALLALLCLAQGCGAKPGPAGLLDASTAPGAAGLSADASDGLRFVAQASAPGGFALRVWEASLLGGASIAGCTLAPTTPTPDAGDGQSACSFDIAVSGAQGLKALMCDVAYDAARWHPAGLEVLPRFGAPSEVLSISHLAQTGRVEAGGVLCNYEAHAGLSGDGALLRISFAAGAQPAVRASAAAPQSGADAPHLNWIAAQNELQWEYRCTGDYNQDGKVGLTDMVPIALYFNDIGPDKKFPDTTLRAVADGDGNGRIGLPDLSALGANWGMSALGGYCVYRSQNEQDYPQGASTPPDAALKLGMVEFKTAAAAVGQRKRFAFHVTDPAPGDCYWVRPNDGIADGVPSSLERYAPAAAGAWPMACHDVQRTNCSPYVGPSNPQLLWTYRPESGIGGWWGEAAVGPDGVVYVACSDELHAYYHNGGLKWALEGIMPSYPPTITSDGKVYIDGPRALLAIDDTGQIRWQFNAQGPSRSAAGRDGTIYTTCGDNLLRAFAPDGTLKWSFDAGVPIKPPPVVGQGGLLFLNSGAMIYKFTPSGELIWQRDILWATDNPPVEAPDGTVYIANDLSLIGLNKDGTARFQYASTDGWVFNNSPAVGADSTAYVESADGVIYAISPGGALRWKYDTQAVCDHAPVIDPQGRLCYIADGKLERLSLDGKTLKEFSLEEKIFTYPTYDKDNRMYISTRYLQVLSGTDEVVWRGEGDASLETGVVIAADGTAYISRVQQSYPYENDNTETYTLALDGNGQPIWSYASRYHTMAPVLAADGKIFLGESDSSAEYLTCLDPAAGAQWSTPLTGTENYGGQNELLLYGGMCYFLTSAALLAYNGQGEFVARHNATNGYYYDPRCFGVDSQGNLITSGYGNGVQKLTPQLELVAQYQEGYMHAFCIGPQDEIYVTSHSHNYEAFQVTALNQDLSVKWRYEIPCASTSSMLVPSLGLDGTVYCVYTEEEAVPKPAGGYTYTNYDRILAVNPAGEFKWASERQENILTCVTVDAAGNSYVVTNDGLRSYGPDAQPRWYYPSYGMSYDVSNPAIDAKGTLYFVNPAGRLYALADK
jgi:hypothetical protein